MAPPPEETLALLKLQKPFLRTKFNVSSIGIFGSVARNEATEASDIDILVEFDGRIGLAFVDLAEFLENLLGAKVDLVSRRALHPDVLSLITDEIRNA